MTVGDKKAAVVWIIIAIVGIGISFWIDGCKEARREAKRNSRYSTPTQSQPLGGSFTGSSSSLNRCERCSCTRYFPKGVYDTDCGNCGHLKGWHYSH